MYIKQIELSRFKSFGSTTTIPLLTGFTVVSGPNGSGKSNILDALLFALGLSSSKGMRADRLPDLVNQSHSKKGRTVEAYVSVTFSLDDDDNAPAADWMVTRKLRVTGQGTYTSTYYINGTPCTLGELHEQLAKFRIYPEGYNVVLQGDVTSIISMNARDRREIIDELAGVGEFDRKILQAKEKLDDVKAQEERFRIVEQELVATQEKLKSDRVKAEKYQTLRAELDLMLASEQVLQLRQLQHQKAVKEIEIANCRQKETELKEQLAEISTAIAATTTQLEQLNARVHQMGEEEYLAVSSEIAAKNAELRSLQRQQQELTQTYQNNQASIANTQAEIDACLRQLDERRDQKQALEQEADMLAQARSQQADIVSQYRKDVQAIAASSAEWVRHQSQLFQAVEGLQEALVPQQQEQARLRESLRQWSIQLASQESELSELQVASGRSLPEELAIAEAEVRAMQSLVQTTAAAVGEAQVELQTCRETIERLTQEQRLKSRQLDKLEAQAQAAQEVQGTRAMQAIAAADVRGVYGLVAQLGRVEPQFQLALEIAAGNRLSNLVVESDEVAAEAINLLKLERAGRATFLPLNKLRSAAPQAPIDSRWGAIDYALNLIDFEPRYLNVFAYVFGTTLVYEHLEIARAHIGKYRMVTLEGDLLETTGAITGGSLPSSRTTIHFGTATTAESSEIAQLRDRLQEIDRMLERLHQKSRDLQQAIGKQEEQLQGARTNLREAQVQTERFQEQHLRVQGSRERLSERIQQNRLSIDVGQSQLTSVEISIRDLETQLQVTKQQLAELEQSGTHLRWQQAQGALQSQEQQLNAIELSLRAARQKVTDNETQGQLTQEKIAQRQARLQELRTAQTELLNGTAQVNVQVRHQESHIVELQEKLDELEKALGSVKQERDACDRTLRAHQTARQQVEWEIEKTLQQQNELQQLVTQLQLQLEGIELPDLLPEIPETLTLEQAQLEQRRLQKRLQAMEPVNMMAIAEYDNVSVRLAELSSRLETLNQERTELLLRIENFTTLRQRAFMQAFDAINENFKTIFAELSDGDGYLQLENAAAPLSGGLNLVAHPKGKPVQHLASMSGGEKSLTALSFIFALQRYRPSPFYAFDEVDMFLDGSNVERLSRMVRKQADLAQFIVVSLRRPMIEAAERTIGVTQARGAHTQVLGMELRSMSEA